MQIALFDLDGTLVDSIPAMKRVYFELLSDLGKNGTEIEFQEFNGKTLKEIVAALISRYSLSESQESLLARYHSKINLIYPQSASLQPHAKDMLNRLSQRGIQIGLVTSSPLSLAKSVLERHEIQSYFTRLICAEDFVYGKPAPDAYLSALKKFQCSPTQAIAIEDSENGVCSARSAGIRTLWYTQDFNLFDCIKDLKQIEAKLDTWTTEFNPLMWFVPKLPFNVTVETSNRSKVPSPLQAEIDQIWNEERLTKPYLFDGDSLTLSRFDSQGAKCVLTPYRSIYATKKSKALRKSLNLNGLAISGIMVFQDELFVGQRSQQVTSYPGYFELAPSGGLAEEFVLPSGQVDFMGQLLSELNEEVGIASDQVLTHKFVAVVYDHDDDCFDIGYELTLKSRPKCNESGFVPNSELTQLFGIKKAQVPEFVKKYRETIVPTTLALLEAYFNSTSANS